MVRFYTFASLYLACNYQKRKGLLLVHNNFIIQNSTLQSMYTIWVIFDDVFRILSFRYIYSRDQKSKLFVKHFFCFHEIRNIYHV